jgi:hypothetical protein
MFSFININAWRFQYCQALMFILYVEILPVRSAIRSTITSAASIGSTIRPAIGTYIGSTRRIIRMRQCD